MRKCLCEKKEKRRKKEKKKPELESSSKNIGTLEVAVLLNSKKEEK
jgi:hypothetical protein